MLFYKRIIGKVICGCSLMLLSCTVLRAQASGLPVEYYSVNDGLSDRMVSDIYQSPDGLLWFGTPNGLNRFDGYNFLPFDNHPDNPRQISDANIKALLPCRDGRVALVFSGGFARFDLFDPLTHEREVVELLPEYDVKGIPRAIATNHEGEVVVLSIHEGAVNLYRYLGNQQFNLEFSVQENHNYNSTNVKMLPLSDGSYLLQDAEKGVRHFSSDGYLLRRLTAEDFLGLDRSSGLYPGNTPIFHETPGGAVYISIRGQAGLYRYHPRERRLEYVESLPRWQHYTRAWQDGAGNILIGSTDKPGQIYPLTNLMLIRPDGRQYDYSKLLLESKFIVSAHSHNFFETFILGVDTGLKIIQNQRSSIQTLLAKDISSDHRGAVMRGMAGDGKGTIYMAREVNHWYALRLDSSRLDTLRMIDEETGEPVPLSCGRNLCLDEEGYLWGVSCLDGQTGKLHRYNTRTDTVRTYHYPSPITAFTIGQDGLLYLCTEPASTKGALVTFDPRTERFEQFTDPEGNNPLSDASPRFVLHASDGYLWIGTEDGLYRIDPEKRSSQVYTATRGEPDGLASNIIYAIHEDEEGKLWLGTTNGFNIFDPAENSFEHYNQRDGLASNTVCGFLPDTSGNYWISTFNGLSYFDRSGKAFRNFFKKEGLTHDEFNRFSYYKDKEGTFYFGGVNGVNIFRSEDLLKSNPTPAPILTRVTRYNGKLDTMLEQVSGLHQLDRVVIQPSDLYFTLHYALPNYTSPRRNQYQTFLAGYDETWTYQGETPYIRLNRLPVGDYELLVRGSDANGNWSDIMLRVPIEVLPAVYQTPWFWGLMALLLFIAIYFFFQYRLERKLEVERLRTKLSSDLHDEVSGLLAGIAMQTDRLTMTVKDPDSQVLLRQMGEVSRKAMSKMSDVIWSVDSRKDRFEDLLTRMREHAGEILTPLEIRYHIDVERVDQKRKMKVNLRQNLYFIFKEAINNVAKHSQATEVWVRLYNEGANFHMTIEDNGNDIRKRGRKNRDLEQGIPGASSRGAAKVVKSGQGLANLKMRAERIKADLKVGERGRGFQVCLRCDRFA